MGSLRCWIASAFLVAGCATSGGADANLFAASEHEAIDEFLASGLPSGLARGVNIDVADLPTELPKIASPHVVTSQYLLSAAGTADVILQPGHYGRTTGRTGACGKLVCERDLVATVAELTASKLAAAGISVKIIAADGYPRPLETAVFLAIHADGSERPCSSGPSLGYANSDHVYAAHAVGYALAQSMGYDYPAFRRDNFTANLLQYYAFQHVAATEFEAIVEIGEITCESVEANLLVNREAIATNLATAIRYALDLRRR